MKRYVRFSDGTHTRYGILEGTSIRTLRGTSPEDFVLDGEVKQLGDVRLLVPCEPTKIVGTGLNYNDVALKEGEDLPEKPKLFLKPVSALIPGGEAIIQPPMVKNLSCEVELGVVIGRRARYVREADAMEYVWGYLVANDLTASDLQAEDVLWGRAKSFDTFLPVSTQIVSGIDPRSLALSSTINGREGQRGNTANLIRGVAWLISYISHVMTLQPGDMIITGTPSGYGLPVKPGDWISMQVESVGAIENTVTTPSEPYYF